MATGPSGPRLGCKHLFNIPRILFCFNVAAKLPSCGQHSDAAPPRTPLYTMAKTHSRAPSSPSPSPVTYDSSSPGLRTG